ncbi:hypothetical protein AB0B86_17555 [Micromonospora sp. NPDC049047]|uniref:hypothetical protein n=1 Tax=Micromonospora sp. NPDC049047 TaxID=3155645 RepID=UPI0033F4483C
MTEIFADERLLGFCIFCGGKPDTRDHVPPKVFLDKPYPDNLLIVGSCDRCNGGSSLDEQFVACLLEVVMCGTVEPGALRRPNIARTLTRSPALAAQLEQGLQPGGGFLVSELGGQRLARVLEKIGRGLWAYQTQEPTGTLAARVGWNAWSTLSDAQRQEFITVRDEVFPELGSRMFIRLLEEGPNRWTVVQEGRFAYLVEVQEGGGRIKLIIGDYLAGEVDLVGGTDG